MVSEPVDVWSRILAIETMPKVKHFLWRMSHGCAAVLQRLKDCHITEDGLCPRSQQFEESVVHALFFCPVSLCMWEKQGWLQLISDAPSASFAVMLMWLLDKLQGNDLLRFLGTLWALWSIRNNAVMGNSANLPEVTLRGFTMLLADYGKHARAVALQWRTGSSPPLSRHGFNLQVNG